MAEHKKPLDNTESKNHSSRDDKKDLKQLVQELETKIARLQRERGVYAAKTRLLTDELDHYRSRETRHDGTVDQLLERQHELNVMLNRSNIMLAKAHEAASMLSLEFGELARALPETIQGYYHEAPAEIEDQVHRINDLFKKTGELSEEIAETLEESQSIQRPRGDGPKDTSSEPKRRSWWARSRDRGTDLSSEYEQDLEQAEQPTGAEPLTNPAPPDPAPHEAVAGQSSESEATPARVSSEDSAHEAQSPEADPYESEISAPADPEDTLSAAVESVWVGEITEEASPEDLEDSLADASPPEAQAITEAMYVEEPPASDNSQDGTEQDSDIAATAEAPAQADIEEPDSGTSEDVDEFLEKLVAEQERADGHGSGKTPAEHGQESGGFDPLRSLLNRVGSRRRKP